MNAPDVASIRVSDRARARIRSLTPGAPAPVVRFHAESSEAGELEMALGFDAPDADDAVVRLEGLTLLLDAGTRALCRRAHIDIDYEEGAARRGFVLRRAEDETFAGVAKPVVLPNSSLKTPR